MHGHNNPTLHQPYAQTRRCRGAQLARVLAGAFLVLQALLLLDCVYATSEWLTDRPGPLRMAALIAARAAVRLRCICRMQ